MTTMTMEPGKDEAISSSSLGHGEILVASRFLDAVLNDLTAALNWYASHNAKLQLNGIRAKRQGVEPFWIWQIRLQFDY